ncbi:MAG: methyltransferase domain-containing protein, partial [Duncaniella sp.]|nr:methyltransferase domain-containing protein [Duncaniella sp.]
YDDNADVQMRVAAAIINKVAEHVTPPVGTMLEVGCGTGRPTRLALESFKPRKAILWDLHISPQIEELSRRRYPDTVTHGCDAEVEIRLLADNSVDLLLSASTVQWFNSLRAFLEQVRRVLTRGGMAAISTYGSDTMREVHEATGTECRFPSLASIRRMIPDGLDLVVACEEHITDLYDSPLGVLRHLSRTGVNGLRPSSEGDTAAGLELLRAYPVDTQGHAPLTYHPIYIILRKS